MRSRSIAVLALTVLGTAATPATAQRPRLPSTAAVRRAAEGLTAEGMRREIARLSDDSVRGRMTPSPELDEVAAYIAGEFRRLGLRPAGDSGSYLQRYRIRCTQPDSTSFVELAAGGATAHLPLGSSLGVLAGQLPEGEASGRAVLWVGVPADTSDLFGTIDLRNATIIAVLPASGLQRANELLPHVMRAMGRGASQWLVVTDLPSQAFARMVAPSLRRSCAVGSAAGEDVTALVVRDSSAMEVLRAAGEDVTALLASQTPVVRTLTGVTVRWRGNYLMATERSAPNVVGTLPGGDAALRSEHLVVMAHMDHLGVGRPVNGDSIYNGADDNASGTAAVLEIARAFQRLGVRPRRSVIFMAVSGEEEGLWGSGHYVTHPAAPLAQTVADLDLDMISRGWRDSVSVIGLDFSSLGETIRRVAREHAALVAQPVVDHWPEEGFLYRSDHINFAQRGVPILYFLDGTPPDYHRVTDSVEKIDAEAAAPPAWDPAARQRLVTGGN